MDPYRVTIKVTGTGHHTVFFKTGSVLGNWVALRITARPSTAGLWFVVDNFTFKEHKGVGEDLLHSTDFNASVMSGVNVSNDGLLWKPFNNTITTLSIVGTTDKKIQVNCTNVNDSRLTTEFVNVTGGAKYLVKFSMTEPEADKRLFLQLQFRSGTGAWTYFLQGTSYTGSGNYHFNFAVPAGADQLKVEFLRAAEGLNVPYTIDDFSITKLTPVDIRTTRVAIPEQARQEKIVCIGMDLMARRRIMK